MLAVLSVVLASPGRAEAFREYDLKAAMVVNLAVFIDWPPAVMPERNDPFVIGVLGIDPFGESLEALAAGQRIRDRRLVVRRLSRRQPLAGCHIIFIARSEERRLAEIMGQLAHHPVLTVSDIPGFTEAGGMIGLGVEDRRVVLHANPAAMRDGSLTASSKLLRLARITSPAVWLKQEFSDQSSIRYSRWPGRSSRAADLTRRTLSEVVGRWRTAGRAKGLETSARSGGTGRARSRTSSRVRTGR